MPALVPVHGGLTEPVCRTVPADQIAGFVAHAKTLTQVRFLTPIFPPSIAWATAVEPVDRSDGLGTYRRVLDESVIEHQGKLYAWTIPIALPVTAELAARLRRARRWPW